MSRSSDVVNFSTEPENTARMSWQALLCQSRLHPKKRNHSRDRTPFEVDYDRLIFSKPFRRLARKTQVHPLATNDHTHNRLTHSLEVASVGRSLGKAAFSIARRQEQSAIPATAEDFAQLVQAACLAHDVGNTPFGHAGERAIRNWMSEQPGLLQTMTNAQQSDLTLYEGNAQAFRLTTNSVDELNVVYGNNRDGLSLTAATLATMMKYPWHSDNTRALAAGKYSVFQSEVDAFGWVVGATGLLPIDEAYCRHPLAFLVEAADDICNSVIDIEDAIDLHILQECDVRDSLVTLSGLDQQCTISQLRASAIGNMLEACLQVFEEQYNDIMHGLHTAPLIDGINTDLHSAFNQLNTIASKKVYPFQQNRQMRSSCDTTLSRILTCSTACPSNMSSMEKDAVTTPFLEFLDSNLSSHKNDYDRLMHVMDFVAGMTDNYAVNLAGRLPANDD